MKEILEEFGKSNWVTGLGTIASIVGFLLSTYLILLTRNLRRKLLWLSEIRRFNSKREAMVTEFQGCRDLITKDRVLDEKLISQITELVNDYKNYTTLMSIVDKYQIFMIKRQLKIEIKNMNTQKLCILLTYFISSCKNPREELL
ncbi:MAG: hypothetical protein ACM3MK_11205 [Chitinophagales bacterium]